MSAVAPPVPSAAIIDACVVGAWSFREKDTPAAQAHRGAERIVELVQRDPRL